MDSSCGKGISFMLGASKLDGLLPLKGVVMAAVQQPAELLIVAYKCFFLAQHSFKVLSNKELQQETRTENTGIFRDAREALCLTVRSMTASKSSIITGIY